MKPRLDWNDLAYFSAIAGAGGLARAAEEVGVSQATLSRRMRAFEAQLGRRLFLHGSNGYRLTSDGQALAQKIRNMDQAAQQIAKWQEQASGPVCVRISAGTWTALDLAERLSDYWSPEDPWVPEFIFSDRDLDIARREIDIGVRNRQPNQPWAARQQLGWVDYAVYAVGASVKGWIGPGWGAVETPSSRWVQANHGDEIVTKANSPYLASALAKAGIGRLVLPVFVGARMDGLVCLSDPITELRSEQWLVSHHEARNDPPVRAALTAVADYLSRRADMVTS